MSSRYFRFEATGQHSQRGLTIIELMIGTVLFLTVSAGVYQFVRQFSNNTANTQAEIQTHKRASQFKRIMQEEIENIVPLQNSRSSFLSVLRPLDCVNVDDVNEVPEMSWSVIPFPGYSLTDYTSNPDFGDLFTTPIDPTRYADNASEEDAADLSDGIIFITIDRESPMIHMARDVAGSLFQSELDEPLVLENRDGIDIGDYLLVSDSLKRDLIRVTDIAERADGLGFNIAHTNTSIWNIPFNHNFGYQHDNDGNQIEIPGGVYVVKANVVSYFFDATTNTIQKDSHLLDDGFNPNTKAFDAPGLAYSFDPILTGVEQMKIHYRIVDPVDMPGDGIDTILTRTPRPGIYGRDYPRCHIVPGAEYCDCQNQIGFSDMKKIELEITMLPDRANPSAPGEQLATNLTFIPKKLIDPPFGSSASLLLTKPASGGGNTIVDTISTSDVPVGGGGGGGINGNSGSSGGGGGN